MPSYAYEIQHKPKKSDMSTLIGLCIVAVVVLGGALAIIMQKDTRLNFAHDFFAALSSHKSGAFRIGDTYIGMSLDTFKTRIPQAQMAVSPSGQLKAVFRDTEGSYTISFTELKGQQVAYRIRYQRVFSGHDTSSMLEKMGKGYGRPAITDCSKSTITGTDRCQFQWWLANNTRLNIQAQNTGNGSLKATVSVFDSYLEGRRSTQERLTIR